MLCHVRYRMSRLPVCFGMRLVRRNQLNTLQSGRDQEIGKSRVREKRIFWSWCHPRSVVTLQYVENKKHCRITPSAEPNGGSDLKGNRFRSLVVTRQWPFKDVNAQRLRLDFMRASRASMSIMATLSAAVVPINDLLNVLAFILAVLAHQLVIALLLLMKFCYFLLPLGRGRLLDAGQQCLKSGDRSKHLTEKQSWPPLSRKIDDLGNFTFAFRFVKKTSALCSRII